MSNIYEAVLSAIQATHAARAPHEGTGWAAFRERVAADFKAAVALIGLEPTTNEREVAVLNGEQLRGLAGQKDLTRAERRAFAQMKRASSGYGLQGGYA